MDTFLQDCDPESQAQAADHLARQSVQVTGQPVGAAAWQQMASTYLVYAQDRDAPLSGNASLLAGPTTSSKLAAGHHPFRPPVPFSARRGPRPRVEPWTAPAHEPAPRSSRHGHPPLVDR